MTAAEHRLKGLFVLPCHVRLFIPSTNGGGPAQQSAWTSNAEHQFSTWFGGSTSYVGSGSWVSKTDGLVCEKVIIVESYCQQAALDAHIEDVLSHVGALKAEAHQEAVALEVNDKLYLV